MPFEAVEDGGKGIGEDVVVVDELTIETAGAVGNAPAESLGGTREDLADAVVVLEADRFVLQIVGGSWVAEATGLDDVEEAPADLRFFLGGEFNRDDASGEGTVEQCPETFAYAGGVDDDVLRGSLLGKVLDLTEDGEVVLTGPGVTGEDAVGGMVELGERGEVDGDDGEGGGVTPGVAKAFAEEGGGEGGFGFVHAGDVDQECNSPSPIGASSHGDPLGIIRGQCASG
jgi:hypothetical protein